MKILLLILLILTACRQDGTNGKKGKEGKNGTSCSVIQSEASKGEASISCGNGTSVVLKRGAKGQQGTPGTNGKEGSEGKDGINGSDGLDGKDGSDGENGEDYTQPSPTFRGFWVLPNKGYLEIIKNKAGNFIFHGIQKNKSKKNRKTVYEIKTLTNGKISVNIKIYNSAGLVLEVTRTIESE